MGGSAQDAFVKRWHLTRTKRGSETFDNQNKKFPDRERNKYNGHRVLRCSRSIKKVSVSGAKGKKEKWGQ